MSTFTSDGTENRMRWDRRSNGFMEVWYTTLNHPETGAGLWFRYTLTSPKSGVGTPFCELWGFYFDPEAKKSFGAKHRYPIDRLGGSNGRDDGALVRIGDAWLSERHLEGEVSREGRSLAWSLDFEPSDKCFQHLPPQIRKRVESKVSTVCSPNLSVPFSGSVKVDGEVLQIDRALGCQSHRWGRKHSSTWAWAHCSTFEHGEDAVFEGVTARATFGPVPAPTMTFLFLRYKGEELTFNDLKWALRAKSSYEMPTWAFTARNDEWKIAGAARVQISKMMQVAYMDPDGSPRHCANSEIADLAIEVYRRDGQSWRHDGSLTALRTAHLEFGRRDPFVELPVTV
jgi:hypothetical protein